VTEADIEALEERLRLAMQRSDLDELEALLADDLLFTDHLGGTWGKQDDIAAHRARVVEIRSVHASEQRVRLLGGVAVVSVRLEIAGTFGGQAASGSFRFMRVWAPAADRRWQVVAAQSTLVAPPD
jgi:uncharacterized protein (TIGR02246 family)